MFACGGSSSTLAIPETPQPEPSADLARFSLGLSDAPVDDAVAVVIELESIRLTHSDESNGRQEVLIDTFIDDMGEVVQTIQVNLLDYQGNEQVKIVDEAQEIEIENGIYSMELNVIDEGSYVLLDNDATEYEIKVPSSRLRLGEFTVSNLAEQAGELPAYTVEFDLRQSLVLRGNLNNNNGFIIKPHGVRIVSLAGSIAGTISPDFTNLGECIVYLYDASVTEYGDVFDIDDEAFIAPDTEITASAPLATAKVSSDGTYAIGFVPERRYQLALTCGIQEDDNIQYDGLTIPSAEPITPDVINVDVGVGEPTQVDF